MSIYSYINVILNNLYIEILQHKYSVHLSFYSLMVTSKYNHYFWIPAAKIAYQSETLVPFLWFGVCHISGAKGHSISHQYLKLFLTQIAITWVIQLVHRSHMIGNSMLDVFNIYTQAFMIAWGCLTVVSYSSSTLQPIIKCPFTNHLNLTYQSSKTHSAVLLVSKMRLSAQNPS